MKYLAFTCLLVCGLIHPAFAQITITNSVFPVVGDTLHYFFGNQPGAINQIFTPPGGPQSWDLTSLQAAQNWDQVMKSPQAGSANAAFPAASVLFNPVNSGSEVYWQVTGSQVNDLGYFGLDPLGLGLTLLFKKIPGLEQSWAPMAFFDIHQSTSNVLTAFDAPAAPPVLLNLVPAADSFRIRVAYQRIASIDAFGTLAIPGGSFDVLRKKQTEYRSTAVDVKVAPLGWIDISTVGGQQLLPLGTDTITTYHFLNDISKEAIAICTLNTAQNAVTSVQYKAMNQNMNITFTATPANTCPGSSNGQIAVTGVTGGTGPYMYSKDNGVTYQAGATFTGLAAGIYNVVVKDALGEVSNATQVTVGTFPAPSCTITGPDFVCNNTPGIVYSAPAGMSAYSWSISGNGSIPGSTTGSSVSVTSGNYLNDYTVSVMVSDSNGCTSSCDKQSFIYLAKPPADITANPDPVCLGAILDLSVSAAASSTVSWLGEGINNPNGNPSTTAVPTTTGPHLYKVTITTDQGCVNTDTTTVQVKPLPVVSCPGNMMVCIDAPPFALTGGSPAGGNYSGPGVSNNEFDPGAAGAGYHVITYVASDGSGCSNSCTFTIMVDNGIPVQIVSNNTYCAGDPGLVIGVDPSFVNTQYQLQDTVGNNFGAPVAGTGGPIFFGAYPNGVYRVVATSGQCGGSATAWIQGTEVNCRVMVPDFCACNSPGGFTEVVVEVHAPPGMTWTVKDRIGFYEALPPNQPMPIGTPMTYVGNNTYRLTGARTTNGYWVQVTNGSADIDVMVGTPSW